MSYFEKAEYDYNTDCAVLLFKIINNPDASVAVDGGY